MKKSLKLVLVVAVLALAAWIGPAQRSEAGIYKSCSQMQNCSPNGTWSACWNANLELVRCLCTAGHWNCSYP